MNVFVMSRIITVKVSVHASAEAKADADKQLTPPLFWMSQIPF